MAEGDTCEEAFEAAALAVTEVMTNSTTLEPKISNKIEIFSYDLPSLFYKWIEALLILKDDKNLVFREFHVKLNEQEMRLEAHLKGEEFDPTRHEQRTVVKAMTYHEMEIDKEPSGKCLIKFVVDI